MQNTILRLGVFILLLTLVTSNSTIAQGPPITSDKPIMLGSNRIVFKTLTELRLLENGYGLKAPAMIHYLPSSNSLIGLHVPLTSYSFLNQNNETINGISLGDIEVLGKYQFFRKDGTGKTFRLVAKTLQTIPTGKKINFMGISTGKYQSYLGIVSGFESIKYGISSEIGYNLSPFDQNDEIRVKLGFGLPLLKPTYPVNQINLYFEYQANTFVEQNSFSMLYAQGIQYAKGRFTIETAIQFPLLQINMTDFIKQRYSIFFGIRYVI